MPTAWGRFASWDSTFSSTAALVPSPWTLPLSSLTTSSTGALVSSESFHQTTSTPLSLASGVPCQVSTDPRPRSPTCSSGIWEIRVVYLLSRSTSRHNGTNISLHSMTIMSASVRLVLYGLKGGQIFLLLWLMNSNSEVPASTASTVKRSLTRILTWRASSAYAAKRKSKAEKLEKSPCVVQRQSQN